MMQDRPDYILDVPDEMILRAQTEGRRGIILPVPPDYAGEVDIFLHTPLSGRIYRPHKHDIRIVRDDKALYGHMAEAGLAQSKDLQDLQGLYARSLMAVPTRYPARLMIVTWQELQAATLNETDAASRQRLLLSRQDFFHLHYVTAKERDAAERQDREPVPHKTGHVMKGAYDLRPGPVRLVETDQDGHATGWESESTILPGQVWRGELLKLPEAFGRAHGAVTRDSAIFNLRGQFSKAGTPLNNNSIMTAVIFEPAHAENVSYRNPDKGIITLGARRGAGPGKPGPK